MTFKKTNFTRRQALTATAALTAVSAAACTQNANQTTQPDNQSTKKPLVLDYKNPIWNRDALARIHGNLDSSKEKIGWFKGKAIGVVPGKKNLEICGFEGFSVTRLIPWENGCLLYTSPSPRDLSTSRMPSSA